MNLLICLFYAIKLFIRTNINNFNAWYYKEKKHEHKFLKGDVMDLSKDPKCYICDIPLSEL